jgi:D-alanyl-D-alanine carboxypeptidase
MRSFKIITAVLTAAGILACGFFPSSVQSDFFQRAFAETDDNEADLSSNDDNSTSASSATDNTNVSRDVTEPLLTDGPEITSGAAVVIDINSGSVLYAKNALESEQPSSLTKLLTAYVCFNELELTQTITCSTTAASQDFPTAANVGYTSGSTYSVYDAIKGSLVASAEDSTYSLCEKACGSMTGFAALMNSYGKELGLLNSNFVNGLGKYEEGQSSCAYDLALVASALMKSEPELKTILGTSSLGLSSGGITISNTHRFINGKDSYSYAYAGKTGGTAYGGDGTWALCTYASYKGLNLVCIVLNAPENETTYEDTKKLFDYAFDAYEAKSVTELLSSSTTGIGTLFSDCEMFEAEDSQAVYIDESATVIVPAGADSALITHEISLVQIDDYLYGENVIGAVDFYYKGQYAGKADILFYTENASMLASEFAKYFPSFLINPDNAQGVNQYSVATVKTEKNTTWNKIKAGIYNLYTPAKSFAAICGALIFLIGTIVILLIFPVKRAPKDKLFSKQYNTEKTILPDDELSEVRYVRPEEFSDMQEVNFTSSAKGK